jgi:hypothetical protein
MCAAESSDRWNERQAENMALDQCDRDNPLVAIGRPRPILDILRDGCDPQYGTWAPICRRAVEEIERLQREINALSNTQGDTIAKEGIHARN